ncbi:hypothetical protein Tco_1451775 [Tanacetum coccineum]
MQGTSLTKQERECKLYDAFDKFTHIKGKSLHQYYLRFTQLINDINIYKMKMERFQVNTKFLNSLPPEWSKFVTDVKLVKDLHTTNFDQVHAYLEQHELHANEVCLIRENAQFADFEKEINNLKQTISEQSKEKELLTKTFNVLKNESKEKEAMNIDTEIALEKKVKELENIVSLGFQNPFSLKKAQRNRPMLYDGNVIAKETNVISIADSKETLMLEEESRSKMLLKQSDQMVLEKKVNTKPINFAKLNRLSEDFGKCFVRQRELTNEQALHPITDQSASSSIKIEALRELPKASLVNTSLKKLKYHLGQFDNVVKKRITPNALTKGEWGFKHTKAIFLNEIIPLLNTLKDISNVFDKDLLNDVTEILTVFNQMKATVQQYSIDKQCFEIQKK